VSATVAPVTARGRFLHLDGQRGQVIARAVAAAKVTIPSVFPPQPHNENAKLSTPYQGLGARAVNNLSAKIVLALFPPNSAFFRLGLDEAVEEAMQEEQIDLEAVGEKLAKIERIVVSRMEKEKLRSFLALAARHLLVAGNGCLDVAKEGIRFHPLHAFVVERDNAGNVCELVIKEMIAPELLDEDTRRDCKVDTAKNEYKDGVEVFTHVVLKNKRYEYHQEINDIEVPGSSGHYKADAPRFIVLRWTIVSGENYGRGLVDEHIGDFNALDDLSRDLLKASAAAAKVVFLTRPGSMLRPKDVANAKSGDVLQGLKDDVGTISLDKFADFRITLERMRDLKDELSAAFLMNSSIQRNAERVTAEEIRTMAQELEDALGGVYSLLAQELQAPLVRRWLHLLTQANQIPALPDNDINLVITTGLDALGRGHELNKLMGALRALTEVYGPEQVAARTDFDTVASRVFTAFGVDQKKLVKDAETMQAEQQQGLMQGIAQDAIPGMLQQVAKGAMQ
jgi:hypothetical protein